jgi:hypothetical protein
MTTLPVKISYPSEIPAWPAKPGTGNIFTLYPPEVCPSVLEDKNMAWLGIMWIELPPNWDGSDTEFWFHPKETGVYLLRTTPSTDFPNSDVSIRVEVLS